MRKYKLSMLLSTHAPYLYSLPPFSLPVCQLALNTYNPTTELKNRPKQEESTHMQLVFSKIRRPCLLYISVLGKYVLNKDHSLPFMIAAYCTSLLPLPKKLSK